MSKISANIVADSLSPQGHRITTMELVFPRYILAELNTHRVLSKNSASSRAIPFKKMLSETENNPYTPIAWQRDHKGMQGSEYLTAPIDTAFAHDLWIEGRNRAIRSARALNQGVNLTKQLCNRLLEPFMWHKVLLTATEFNNFYELRCPRYEVLVEGFGLQQFYSRKDVFNAINEVDIPRFEAFSEVDWLTINKGQADIHIMALAEAMWDVRKESKPKQLKAGEWHIPYGDSMDNAEIAQIGGCFDYSSAEHLANRLKIATARCARISYQTLGDNPVIDYRKDIALHDNLFAVKHNSPFEHASKAMSDDEYCNKFYTVEDGKKATGWCRNFRGFIQYRHIVETGSPIN